MAEGTMEKCDACGGFHMSTDMMVVTVKIHKGKDCEFHFGATMPHHLGTVKKEQAPSDTATDAPPWDANGMLPPGVGIIRNDDGTITLIPPDHKPKVAVEPPLKPTYQMPTQFQGVMVGPDNPQFESRGGQRDPTRMRTSVIICTIQRDTLKRTLDALALQPYDELILIRDYDKNLSVARNRGLDMATGDLIAFIDDDTIPDSDYIIQGAKFFEENPSIAFMQASVYGGITTSPEAMFIGAGMWVRRSVAFDIGRFDVGFVNNNGGDDVDFGWRLLDAGYKVVFNNKCRVFHPTEPQYKSNKTPEELEVALSRLAQKHPKRWEYLQKYKTSNMPQ